MEEAGELGGGGGFAGAVEADEEDAQGAVGGELGGTFAEEAGELVVDDFDDLLAGGDGLEDLLAGALLLDALDEFAGDLELDIGGEEGGADLLEGLGGVFGRELGDAAQVAQGEAHAVGQAFEHGKGRREARRRWAKKVEVAGKTGRVQCWGGGRR